MTGGIVQALARARKRLNAARAAAKGLVWASAGLLGGAVLGSGLALLGVATRGHELALACAAAALIASQARSAATRCGLADAAVWLDRGSGDQGLFTGALACERRSASALRGPYDQAVLDKALASLPTARGLRVPRAYFRTPALLTAAALVLTLPVLALPSLIKPAPAAMQPDSEAASLDQAKDKGHDQADPAAVEVPDQPSPEELAALLFPDQPEMARLLADALRGGRLDDARKLVDRAELAKTQLLEREGPVATLPDRSAGPSPRERLENAIRLMEDGQAESGDVEREPGTDGGSGDQPDPQGSGDAAPMEAPAAGEGQAGDGTGQAGASDDSGSAGSGGGQPGMDSGSASGSSSGQGQSGQAGSGSGVGREWGDISPLAEGGQAAIAPLEGSAYYELILPGADGTGDPETRARAALAALEAASESSSLPAEYLDLVRAYFLALIAEYQNAP